LAAEAKVLYCEDISIGKLWIGSEEGMAKGIRGQVFICSSTGTRGVGAGNETFGQNLKAQTGILILNSEL